MLQELLSNDKLKKQANRIGLKTNPLVWHFRKLSFLSRFKINEYVRNSKNVTSDNESVPNNSKENKTKRANNRNKSGDYLMLDELLENELLKNRHENQPKTSNISLRNKSKRKQRNNRDSHRDFAKFIIDELEKLPENIAKDCQLRIKTIINEYTNNLC